MLEYLIGAATGGLFVAAMWFGQSCFAFERSVKALRESEIAEQERQDAAARESVRQSLASHERFVQVLRRAGIGPAPVQGSQTWRN
jgi:hypothetical protein